MIGLVILVFVSFMQVQMPDPMQGDPILPSPNVPAPAAPRSTTQSSGSTTVVFRPATSAEIDTDSRIATRSSINQALVDPANNVIDLAKDGLGLGDWLLTRDPKRILDYPPVHTLNQDLRWAGVVVWIVAFGLVLTKHALGPFANAEPTALYLAIPLSVAMGTMGFFNEPILRLIMNAAHALLNVIANATLKDALEPGLRIQASAPQAIEAQVQIVGGYFTAPFIALLVAAVSLLLILKMWAQVGWLFILTAPAPIYMSATGAPFIGRYAAQWWRAWVGTLIDPILMIVGLKIAAAGLGFLDGHLPYLWDQLMTLVVLVPLLVTPGWHSGAYGGAGVDWALGMALYRVRSAMQHRPAPIAPAAPPANMPTHVAPYPLAVSGQNGGTGGGVASNWKTSRWTPQPRRLAGA